MSLSIEAELSGEINKEARKIALKILRGVTFDTPVDEGRARGNWQLSFNKPAINELDVIDEAGNATVSKGHAVLEANKNKKYPLFWIVNNLPYINRLNNGHSKKTGKFFVQRAIKAATNGS